MWNIHVHFSLITWKASTIEYGTWFACNIRAKPRTMNYSEYFPKKMYVFKLYIIHFHYRIYLIVIVINGQITIKKRYFHLFFHVSNLIKLIIEILNFYRITFHWKYADAYSKIVRYSDEYWFSINRENIIFCKNREKCNEIQNSCAHRR